MSNSINVSCPVCSISNTTYQGPYGEKIFLCCNALYECKDCGLIFSHELPKKDELEKYYSNGCYWDQVSDPYSKDIIEFSYRLALVRLNLIQEKIDFPNNIPKVIDIGAGNASFGMALKDICDEFIYDVVEPDTEVQTKYGSWVNKKFNDVADVYGKDYDLAVLNQVLEHMPNPFNFLKSISKLIKKGGYIYIDVPFKDYLFKPYLEPHLMFWNKKSLSILLEKTDNKLIFCDTAGMPHKIAKRYFNQQNLLRKFLNPWKYLNKINQIMDKIGFPNIFDTFNQYQANQYGGDRQWLRCIAQKID